MILCQVYGGVDADAVLVLLAHKISTASAAEGLAEGRALLQVISLNRTYLN